MIRGVAILVLTIVVVVIALKFMVPVAANIFFGFGVEVPLPRWVPPEIAIPLFVIGVPVVFVGCVAGLASLIRSRP